MKNTVTPEIDCIWRLPKNNQCCNGKHSNTQCTTDFWSNPRQQCNKYNVRQNNDRTMSAKKFSEFYRCEFCDERDCQNDICGKYPIEQKQTVAETVERCIKEHPKFDKWQMIVTFQCPFCKTIVKNKQQSFCPTCKARLDPN